MNSWLRIAKLRLKTLFRKEQRESSLDREMRIHLEHLMAENMAAGMNPKQARLAARKEFGHVGSYQEECRDSWGVRLMECFTQDFKFGIRQLIKAPGFTAVVVLTLAIGIGSVTAIYSLVYSTVLKPLPYPNSEQLVALNEVQMPGAQIQRVSSATYLHWQEQATHLESIALTAYNPYTMIGAGAPYRAYAHRQTVNLLSTLGVQPMLGRDFRPDEDTEGKSNVLILGYHFWKDTFQGNPDVLGTTVLLDGQSFTIIGVLPESYHYIPNVELFTPLTFSAESSTNYRRRYQGVARLKAGVSIEQASTQLDGISQQLATAMPEAYENSGARIQSLHTSSVSSDEERFYLLLSAVGCLLLIACTNIANLMLARSSTRQAEISVRTALGASRGRIISQLLGESLTLALIGGALGLMVGKWSLDAIVAFLPSNTYRIHEISMDSHALGFSLILTITTGLIFGLFPALQASKIDLHTSLKDAGRRGTNTNGSTQRLRGALVVTEIALALILLTGAGLFARSMLKAQGNKTGFDPQNCYMTILLLRGDQYSSPEQRISVVDRLVESISGVHGVATVSITNKTTPTGRAFNTQFSIAGHPVVEASQRPLAYYYGITEDFFDVFKIPLLRGRHFTGRDNLNSPSVALINAEMARTQFADQDPIGQLITFNNNVGEATCEIIGVVGDTRQQFLMDAIYPQIYQPYAQTPTLNLGIMLRTTGVPLNMAALSNAAHAVDPEFPINLMYSIDQGLDGSLTTYRSTITIFSVFSIIALLLAVMGIYGVMAYNVAQRTGEIGIRMALGASQSNILKLVLKQGVRLTVIGLIIGLIGALALGQYISTQLYEVSPYDPVTLIIISGSLTIAALLACLLPARRATKVDPMVALRSE